MGNKLKLRGAIFFWRRGRCQKCLTWNEKLYSIGDRRICNICRDEELDKVGVERKVLELEEYKNIVAATQGVTDDIEAA